MPARQLWAFLTENDLRELIGQIAAREPARIYAHVTWWRAAEKARKRPMFSIWASQTLKWIAARLPATSAKMIRVGPEALAEAKEGRLRLRYLYRTISP